MCFGKAGESFRADLFAKKMEGQGPRATLLEALQALYHHPDPQIRNAANQWLEEFQTTMEAWQVRRTWTCGFRYFLSMFG